MLTSRRVYKPPLDPEAARNIIAHESGAHFDPVVVNAFLARFEDFQNTGTPSDQGEGFEPIYNENAYSTAPFASCCSGQID